jgi:glycosyltransferase involved in cell wall biosynthesis
MNFKIIIPTRNTAWNVERLVDTLREQSHTDFTAVLADDKSSDGTIEKWEELTKDDSRFTGFYNDTQLWSTANQVKAIGFISDDPNDVIVKIDGDDALNRKDSLEIVQHEYDKGAWMTQGSIRCASGIEWPSFSRVQPWNPNVIEKNLFRKAHWKTLHLSTYKRFLWDNIDHDRSLKENGEYFKVTEDMARGFPMLEMANSRVHTIPEQIYYYNDRWEGNDHSTPQKRQEQIRVESFIRSQKPYDRLPEDYHEQYQ